ncbi:MAG: SH3 domain-containing protein [Pseudomonadota bacterium]
MSRFVIVSFALMGWTFYELSGGADFEPRGKRSDNMVAAASKSTEPKPVIVRSTPTELVAKSALERRTASEKPVALVASQNEQDDSVPVENLISRLAQVGNTVNVGSNLFEDREGQAYMLASLQQGGASLQQQAVLSDSDLPSESTWTEPQPDLREVTGTRVNMRDGPGTTYAVLARLNIGHKVEVLEESGTGWLRLRVLPEQQMGWIAASLVSKPAN